MAAVPRAGVLEAMRAVIHREGVRALWKGNGVTIIHRLPYSAVNFWTYETVNELWKQYAPSQGPLALGDVSRRLFAGGVAGMSACALTYPLDLVRTRLAAQTTRRYYHGIGHALSTIVRDEGAAGLYRGLGATLAQVGPCLAINYAAYESIRSSWLSKTDLSAPILPEYYKVVPGVAIAFCVYEFLKRELSVQTNSTNR